MPRKQTESRIPLSQDMRWQIFKSANETCAHCGCKMNFYKDFTVEHVIPLHKGGTSRPQNLIALCKTCNKEKSDNIIRPRGYYKYLPKERLAELEALFDEYLMQTDWLAYDNLFQTDLEEVTIQVEQAMRSGYLAKIPTTIKIQKITAEEAFEWLQFYTARLKPEDKEVMAHTPEALKSPYYRITNGTTTYMLCTAYASPINYEAKENGVNAKLHGIRIDLFTNPELNDKPGLTPRLLYAGLCAVMTRIQETLLRGYEQDSLVQCMVQYPASDTYGDRMFEYVERVYPGQFSATTLYDENDIIQPIHGYITWFHQGKRVKSLYQIDPRLNGTAEEITAALLELQNPFKERLEGARQIKNYEPPKKNKKPKRKSKNPKQIHHPEWRRRKRK